MIRYRLLPDQGFVVGDTETGRAMARGTISALMGYPGEAADVIADADAKYRVGSIWRNLAGLLNSTSYGLCGVTVIA